MSKKHVLGITAKRFKYRTFGEQTSYLRGLIRIAAKKGLDAYVFSMEDIDQERRHVNAWVWTTNGWRRRRKPMPTVIYDRMWGMKNSTRQSFEYDLSRLNEDENIPFFNPHFGDKYDVHQQLITNKSLHPHLPMTEIATPDAVARLAQWHKSLYIKPVRGRQGKGIMRLDITRGKFQVKHQQGARQVWTSSSVDSVLTRCLGEAEPENYIVQQGLDLLRVRGGTVDVRVIIQRDGLGQWRVSAVGCRIGPRGGFVSNLHAGGRAASISVLAPYLPRRLTLRKLRQDIDDLALKTAEGMSEFYPTIGEIGLDLGIDREGNIWILELNRQPGRALFSRAGLRQSWRRSRIRVVQFAKYLSENRDAL